MVTISARDLYLAKSVVHPRLPHAGGTKYLLEYRQQRKAWSIVDLPVKAGVEYWYVLDRIRQTGFMLTKVDPFAVCIIVRKAKLNAEETTVGGCRNVNHGPLE